MRWLKKKEPLIPYYEYWTEWFAWYPVDCEMCDGTVSVVWLETVEQRGTYGYGSISWRYREISKLGPKI